MKKVSTVAVKATKNFSQPIGLDLGDRSSWYCLLDEVGDVVQEQKLSTTHRGKTIPAVVCEHHWNER